jgi:hypothetical protein
MAAAPAHPVGPRPAGFGHQVILSGLGHVDDFWYYEPRAGTQLLNAFYDTGRVDTSRYTPNVVSFATSATQAAIAKDLLAAMIGFAVLAALRLLMIDRDNAVQSCKTARTALAAVLVTAPADLREQIRPLPRGAARESMRRADLP